MIFQNESMNTSSLFFSGAFNTNVCLDGAHIDELPTPSYDDKPRQSHSSVVKTSKELLEEAKECLERILRKKPLD